MNDFNSWVFWYHNVSIHFYISQLYSFWQIKYLTSCFKIIDLLSIPTQCLSVKWSYEIFASIAKEDENTFFKSVLTHKYNFSQSLIMVQLIKSFRNFLPKNLSLPAFCMSIFLLTDISVSMETKYLLHQSMDSSSSSSSSIVDRRLLLFSAVFCSFLSTWRNNRHYITRESIW